MTEQDSLAQFFEQLFHDFPGDPDDPIPSMPLTEDSSALNPQAPPGTSTATMQLISEAASLSPSTMNDSTATAPGGSRAPINRRPCGVCQAKQKKCLPVRVYPPLCKYCEDKGKSECELPFRPRKMAATGESRTSRRDKATGLTETTHVGFVHVSML